MNPKSGHQTGHELINSQTLALPYGTTVRAKIGPTPTTNAVNASAPTGPTPATIWLSENSAIGQTPRTNE